MWNITEALTAADSRSVAIGKNSVGLPVELSRQRLLAPGGLFVGTSDSAGLGFGVSTDMGTEAASATSGSKESESGAPLGMLAMSFVLGFLSPCSFRGSYRTVQC